MSSHRHAQPFDITGPLPSGVTVLEASAGTGKTYAIAGLAARYVANGTPLERVLLVTFTRMATGELRERVRERLLSVEHGLERGLAGGLTSRDPVVELLSADSRELVVQRRRRLTRALSDFDAATITTTHGFCQEVLGGLGISADLEPSVTFVEDLSDLVSEVVDDLYVRRFHRGDKPPFGRAQALQIARITVQNPEAAIAGANEEVPEMRRRLALAVRGELEARKRRLAVMTYDDLLSRLDAALAGDDGTATAGRLRARYEVVLIDEFQDTDPVQWDIMRRAFGSDDRALVLIADPKQAIYAFRGADVFAYLDAAREAGTRATLTVNWRSDQGLIDAHDAVFGNARLGDEGIVYRRVRAADANQAGRLRGAPHGAPLRILVVPRESVGLTKWGYARVGPARAHIAKDLAGDLVTLLSSDAEIEVRSEEGATIGREGIHPAHTAVLVRTNRGAALIREALERSGIPAVINGAGSVFGTETAQDWLRLLEVLERPTSITRAHSAALTPFLGWSPGRVAAAGESDWEEVHARLHDWARLLRVKDVASLVETIARVEDLPRRMLGRVDGERRLTDLRHIGQLLHGAQTSEQLGTTALTAWLRRRILEAGQDTSNEERSRRLESDEEAVQVLTIHRSKGLEFPIVYLPFLWEPGYIPDHEPVSFHNPDAANARTLDVALEGADFERNRQRYVIEQRGEDLRLAYVALTRARHQAVVWWAGSWDSRDSPLGRLLFARDQDGKVPATGQFTPEDDAAIKRFEAIAARAPGRISVERSTPRLPTMWRPPLQQPVELTAAAFNRTLDRRWRRTSYSDITAATYDTLVASEPEERAIADEPSTETLPSLGAGPVSDVTSAIPCLLADMPIGVEVGTLVHQVFEATDFAAADLDTELKLNLGLTQRRGTVDIGDPAHIIAGLRAAIETPLGALVGNVRLRDVARADRLDELEFEFPVAGGDQPAGWLTTSLIASVLREQLLPGDPLGSYADRLADPALRQSVRGYLTGSLDLVMRLNGDEGPRFAVLDYKTNWLGGPGEQLTVRHYRPEALSAEMYRHHYALQGLLYTVALHRYLRWRLPGYDPQRNLAGVLYLFVRGMVGPETPVVGGARCGVFAWQPPAGLADALSGALNRGAAV